jgi:hypothetical protein
MTTDDAFDVITTDLTIRVKRCDAVHTGVRSAVVQPRRRRDAVRAVYQSNTEAVKS